MFVIVRTCSVTPDILQAAKPVEAVTTVDFTGNTFKICFKRNDFPVPALPEKNYLKKREI